MTQVADFDRETLVQPLITRAAAEVSADHRTIVADFLALYFARVPGPDLIDTDPNELFGCALSHLESAKKRKSGEVKVRAFNPSIDHDGWVCEHTMVEIISSSISSSRSSSSERTSFKASSCFEMIPSDGAYTMYTMYSN